MVENQLDERTHDLEVVVASTDDGIHELANETSHDIGIQNDDCVESGSTSSTDQPPVQLPLTLL